MIAAQTNALMELIINLITVTSSTYKMLGSLECRPTPAIALPLVADKDDS
jgi:hypothetical protein